MRVVLLSVLAVGVLAWVGMTQTTVKAAGEELHRHWMIKGKKKDAPMSTFLPMMTTVALPPWREPQIFDDLLEMYRRSGTTDVAVMFEAIPQSEPLLEKTRQFVRQFAIVRPLLQAQGIRAGILLQSLVGHGERGHAHSPAPFQRIVGWDGTVTQAAFCPADPEFLRYVGEVVGLLAEAKPAFLLVDDDVRLNNHRPAKWTCACPLHVRAFAEHSGRKLSREEIFAAMSGDGPEAAAVREAWFESGEASMIELMRTIRRAIDAVNPAIRCGKCLSGGRHMLKGESYARALAGNTRPFLRLAGAMYMETSPKLFGYVMTYEAMQRSLMPDDIEYFCEADSCPQTFYSMSRKTLRAFIVGSILAAKVDGPYTWIPNTTEWVRSQWQGYSDMLGESTAYFTALGQLAKKTRWLGPTQICRQVVLRVPPAGGGEAEFPFHWATQVCARLGFAHSVNDPAARTVMLNGPATQALDDQTIRKYLGQSVLLDGEAAVNLCRRGFGAWLGVTVEKGVNFLEADREILSDDALNGPAAGQHISSNSQAPGQIARITATDARARVLGHFVRNRWFHDSSFTRVAPAAVAFENALGGRVLTYAHVLDGTESFLGQSVTFLNPIRKGQMIAALGWLEGSALPAVAQAPADTYLLFGHNAAEGTYVALVVNVNPDCQETVDIAFAQGIPQQARRMGADGQWQAVAFQAVGGITRFDVSLETMCPLVLELAFK